MVHSAAHCECFCPSLGRFIYPPPSAPLTVWHWPRPLIRGRLPPSLLYLPQALKPWANRCKTRPNRAFPSPLGLIRGYGQSPVLCPLSTHRPACPPLYLGVNNGHSPRYLGAGWQSLVLKTASSQAPSPTQARLSKAPLPSPPLYSLHLSLVPRSYCLPPRLSPHAALHSCFPPLNIMSHPFPGTHSAHVC